MGGSDCVALASVQPVALQQALSGLASRDHTVDLVLVRRAVRIASLVDALKTPVCVGFVVALVTCALLAVGAPHPPTHANEVTPVAFDGTMVRRVSTQPNPRPTRGGVRARAKQPNCSQQQSLSFDMPYLCAFGQLVGLVDLGSGIAIEPSDVASWAGDNVVGMVLVFAPHPPPFFSELGLVTSLEFFLLESALEGPIPSQIGLLSNLRLFDILGREIVGTLPSEVGQLGQLGWLSLEYTSVTGTFPSEIGLLSSLTYWVLGGGKATGLPSEIGQLSALGHLDAASNMLSSVPTQLAQLTQLTWLGFNDNRVAGSLFSEIGRLTKLVGLSFQNNELTGTLPSQLGQLTLLTRLKLLENSLTGTIPTELWSLTRLTLLSLGYNALHGRITPGIGGLSLLDTVALEYCDFNGPLPSQLGQLTQLTLLAVDHNSVSGPLPSQLGTSNSLRTLFLSHNGLSGTIPSQVLALDGLQTASIAFNDFDDTDIQQPVWLEDCDMSGIHTQKCKQECGECPLGTFQIHGCDSQGYNRKCLPAFVLLGLVPAFALVGFLLLLALTPKDVRYATVALYTLGSVMDLLDLATDVAFAVASSEAIRTASLVFLSTAITTTFLLTVNTLRQAQHRVPSTTLLTLTVVYCWVSPACLKLVTNQPGHHSRLARTVIVVKLLEDVPQAVLQVISISQSVTTLTLLALLLSAVSVGANLGVVLMGNGGTPLHRVRTRRSAHAPSALSDAHL